MNAAKIIKTNPLQINEKDDKKIKLVKHNIQNQVISILQHLEPSDLMMSLIINKKQFEKIDKLRVDKLYERFLKEIANGSNYEGDTSRDKFKNWIEYMTKRYTYEGQENLLLDNCIIKAISPYLKKFEDSKKFDLHTEFQRVIFDFIYIDFIRALLNSKEYELWIGSPIDRIHSKKSIILGNKTNSYLGLTVEFLEGAKEKEITHQNRDKANIAHSNWAYDFIDSKYNKEKKESTHMPVPNLRLYFDETLFCYFADSYLKYIVLNREDVFKELNTSSDNSRKAYVSNNLKFKCIEFIKDAKISCAVGPGGSSNGIFKMTSQIEKLKEYFKHKDIERARKDLINILEGT